MAATGDEAGSAGGMTFEAMLSGGHPNSPGRTIEVVGMVLENEDHLPMLRDCYRSADELVRLRTSNAPKRVTLERPEWTAREMDCLQGEVVKIDQASTQWTLALLFDLTWERLSDAQRERGLALMRRNLQRHGDWIVLNNCMKVLAKRDPEIVALRERLEELSRDKRKSVASNARKLLAAIE